MGEDGLEGGAFLWNREERFSSGSVSLGSSSTTPALVFPFIKKQRTGLQLSDLHLIFSVCPVLCIPV